jgi:hypothetical protein
VTRANGYFEAFVNARAFRPGPPEHALMAGVTEIVRTVIPRSQVRWAGSQRKGTAIADSDLDLCVESGDAVTEANRRELRGELDRRLARPARVLSHAIRLPADIGRPKVDIAFANAAFGSRPLPDAASFHDRKARQATARGLKLWSRGAKRAPPPGVGHRGPRGAPRPERRRQAAARSVPSGDRLARRARHTGRSGVGLAPRGVPPMEPGLVVATARTRGSDPQPRPRASPPTATA